MGLNGLFQGMDGMPRHMNSNAGKGNPAFYGLGLNSPGPMGNLGQNMTPPPMDNNLNYALNNSYLRMFSNVIAAASDNKFASAMLRQNQLAAAGNISNGFPPSNLSNGTSLNESSGNRHAFNGNSGMQSLNNQSNFNGSSANNSNSRASQRT